jgi:hypothetical protein
MTVGNGVTPAPATGDLSTATQLEASIALAEWQRQRHLPPEQRIVGAHHADLAFETMLELVEVEMARAA